MLVVCGELLAGLLGNLLQIHDESTVSSEPQGNSYMCNERVRQQRSEHVPSLALSCGAMLPVGVSALTASIDVQFSWVQEI